MIDYIPVSIKTFNLERSNPTSNYLTAQITGNYFNGSFGTSNNSLSVQYRYKEAYGTWSSYTTIEALVSGNSYTVNTQLPTVFSYLKQWEVELLVSDKLATDTYSLKISKGIPTIQKSEREFQVNGTFFQADENGQNAVTIPQMVDSKLGPVNEKINNLVPAVCRINTTTSSNVTSSTQYTDWSEGVSLGGYVLDSSVDGILIPAGTSVVEIGGEVAGYNFGMVDILIREKNSTSNVGRSQIMVQSAGNKYWKHSLPTKIYELNPTKEYKVIMMYAPYNDSSFYLNSGFSNDATSIYAKKIA